MIALPQVFLQDIKKSFEGAHWDAKNYCPEIHLPHYEIPQPLPHYSLHLCFSLLYDIRNIFQVGEVSRSGLSNIGSLWGQQKTIRSQYEPCEDSTLNSQEFNG